MTNNLDNKVAEKNRKVEVKIIITIYKQDIMFNLSIRHWLGLSLHTAIAANLTIIPL
jgi:hypothetical protein